MTVPGSSQTPSQSWMNCKPREKAAIANVKPKQNRTTPLAHQRKLHQEALEIA